MGGAARPPNQRKPPAGQRGCGVSPPIVSIRTKTAGRGRDGSRPRLVAANNQATRKKKKDTTGTYGGAGPDVRGLAKSDDHNC